MNKAAINEFRILAKLCDLFPNCTVRRHTGENAPNAIMAIATFDITDTDFTVVTPYGVAITGFSVKGAQCQFMLFVLDAQRFAEYYKIELAQ